MALVLPRPGPIIERELYQRDIQIGADGSILRGDSWVYILWEDSWEDVDVRMERIDYFRYWSHHGVPVAQTNTDFYARADQMIGIASHGFVIRRVRHLQVRFRLRQRFRRATKYNERMIAMGILLATVWRRLHRTA